MKLLYCFLALLITLAGCASSSNNEVNPESLNNLVSLQQPGDQTFQSSKVYIDSVKHVTWKESPALLISGTFPDACTNLSGVSHRIQSDALYIELKAWRNPEMMCAQVLTPFSFVYQDLSDEELSSHTEAIINGTAFSY